MTPDTQIFRDVFNASPIGIAVENLEGQPLFVNRAFCSMLGFSEEELLRKHCSDFSPSEDTQKDWALFQQLRAGSIDHYQIEKRYFRKDGSLVWGRLSLSLLNGGSSPLVIAMVEEITDKKTAEEALRASEERLRLAQQAARIGTFEWNIRTGVNTWTPELEAMYGLRPGGFGGTQSAFENLVHPDDRAVVMKLVEDSLKTGQPTKGEWRAIWADGSVHWIAGRWQVFMNESGEPLRMIGTNIDFTARKLAEERLREYARAVEGSEDMIAVVDREYRYVIVNSKFANRRNMTKEQIVGHLIPEVLNRGVFETIVKEKLDECFQGRVVRFEMKYTYPKLGERDMSSSYFPIEGANGIERVACIWQDITDRKRAEKAIRESEEKFRRVFQDAATGMVMLSPEGRFIAANRAYCEFLGYSEKELTGRAIVSVTHPEDQALCLRLMNQALAAASGSQRYEKRYLHKNGQVLWGESGTTLIRDDAGKPEYFVSQIVNITERKRAEKALRESEEKFRRVFQDAVTGMVMISLESRFLAVNQAFCDFLGYSEKELVGRDVLSVTHPEDHAHAMRMMGQALAGESGSERFEKRSLHKNGQVLWAELRTTVIRDSAGKPEYFVSQIVNVTERKRAEEALAGMTRKLIEAQEQERARIGRELHDDINQRLAMLALELERLKEENPSEVQSHVQELRNQIVEISNDVQSLSHDLHSTKLEYLGVVAGMKSWCKEFAERQKMEIDFKSDVSSTLPLGVGLPLFRVLQEAVHNASKYSGVKRIEVQLREDSGEIHLIVGDSGRGFDLEAALQGKGLGLSSMRERVRLLNGTITIDSKPIGGTSIHVRVPLELEHVSRKAAV